MILAQKFDRASSLLCFSSARFMLECVTLYVIRPLKRNCLLQCLWAPIWRKREKLGNNLRKLSGAVYFFSPVFRHAMFNKKSSNLNLALVFATILSEMRLFKLHHLRPSMFQRWMRKNWPFLSTLAYLFVCVASPSSSPALKVGHIQQPGLEQLIKALAMKARFPEKSPRNGARDRERL